MKFGQVTDKVIDNFNIFRKYFALFQLTGINQKPIVMSYWSITLLKTFIKKFKISNHHLLKMNRSHYNAILLVLFYQNHKRAWN